jgi:hypothetical protein
MPTGVAQAARLAEPRVLSAFLEILSPSTHYFGDGIDAPQVAASLS